MSAKKSDELREKVEMPDGVSAEFSGRVLKLKGPKGVTERRLLNPMIQIEVKGSSIEIFANADSKKEKRMINTIRSHVSNMIIGVSEGFLYKLKICSGHFPMNISAKGEEFNIKNFLGEKIPRIVKLKKGADVKINGDIIEVTSISKELAGQTAADIEQLTRISDRDRRIFQDGIYIIEKAGKTI